MLADIDRARSALFHLDPGCDRESWVRFGMAAKAAGLDVDDWIEWSASGANYGGESETRAVWRSIKLSGGIGAGTLFRAAIDAGWKESVTSGKSTPKSERRSPPGRPARDILDPRWFAYWQSLGSVKGVGRAYLEARACALPPVDGHLRFDVAARHPSGHPGPCLIALVTDVLSGVPISLHRTWVNADGTKAEVDPPRMLLGGHRKAGGVIRLWPDEAVVHGLAIAEGIETALSLAHVFQPVWALIDAGNLAKLPPLPGVEALTIAVDADPAGERAAESCGERWALANRDVTLVGGGHGA
ncbi:PriCT-2 domain-containing protein [Burkholderia seminalis]|uniref:PriCT-2 domain-containing protein n=1 Tax=Burkholderia seminalis TaxID=488731 RepID=UPI001CF30029|nr:PriCT-2 domain-containing protein [Burkholderia seminalis]MCA8301293.1 PriCT-2 domain-containing protein [Burkholderia seminalis]